MFLPRSCSRPLRLCCLLLVLASPSGGAVAIVADADGAIVIPRYDEENIDIRIDGRLNEAIWDSVPYYDEMTVVIPDKGERGRFATHTRLLHTEQGLYVGVWNEQPPETLLARLSSRDSFSTRDSYMLSIDTSGKGLYGYWFQVNLGGSLGDGILLPERDFQRDWDGPWRGAAAATDNGWTAEMFLPWSMMNMPETTGSRRRMGVAGSRSLGHLNERWAWPYLPMTQARFMSALQPIELVDVDPKQEYSVFPYISGSHDGARDESDYRYGIDLFWRPSANFFLNATLNPDFGQVEADDVVVNFTAFETFFPEKRLFFLENQEIFSSNSGGVRLLHTRRIGSSINARRGRPDAPAAGHLESHDANRPVDLTTAVKAVGQTGRLRYGVLAAMEDGTRVGVVGGSTDSMEAPGRDFGIVRLSYEDASRGGRRAIGWLGTVAHHPDRQAMTHGLDAHLLSRNGKVQFDGQLAYSDVPEGSGIGAFVDLRYTPSRGHRHSLDLSYVDDSLDINDLGFIDRNDVMRASYGYFHVDSQVDGLRQRDTSFSIDASYNTDHRRIGGRARLRQGWSFKNNSRLRASLYHHLARYDDRNSRGNGVYRRNATWSGSLNWSSDFAKSVVYGGGIGANDESEGGMSHNYFGQLSLRPSDRVSVGFVVNYTDRDSWLIHRGGRNFTAFESKQWTPRISLSAFLTSNQQLQVQLRWVAIKAVDSERYEIEPDGEELREVARDPLAMAQDFAFSDVTTQIRYRWQIAPLSDLFIVYNRGGSHPGADVSDGFGSLFQGAFREPQREFLIVKLRYRFGS